MSRYFAVACCVCFLAATSGVGVPALGQTTRPTEETDALAPYDERTVRDVAAQLHRAGVQLQRRAELLQRRIETLEAENRALRDRVAAAEAALEGSQALAARLEALRREHGVPALGAASVKNGQLERLVVTGVCAADGEDPVLPEDAWHLGSCTKAMTATLAARLVERRKIAWETAIKEALPELAEDIHPSHHTVTLRQLLAHRSGIGGATSRPAMFGQLVRLDREMADRPLRERRLAVARLILQAEPIGKAGEIYEYSNDGYIVAGAMLEAAGAATWEELMRREVFEPLG